MYRLDSQESDGGAIHRATVQLLPKPASGDA